MKKLSILFAGMILIGSGPGLAQEDDKNLVSNPGFESAEERKLKRYRKIELAENWFSPTDLEADLFSDEAGDESVMVPSNFRGKEPATEGGNYAGVVAFSYNDKEIRTYIMTKLLFPLKKDADYCVRFKIALSDLSKYASNNMGAHLSKKPFEYEEKVSIIEGAHILHPQNEVMNQQFGWQTICGVYTAQGGEEWLTIGNFESNDDTKYERMRKQKEFRARQTYDAYYYVDDVAVFYMDSIQECICTEEKEEVIVHRYERQIVTASELDFNEFVDASAVYFGEHERDLHEQAKEDLDLLIVKLNENPSENIIIHAHSDKNEEEDAKRDPRKAYVAQARGNAVKEYLIENGIDGSRLQVESHDAQEPADTGITDYALSKNRRVTFTVKK